MDISRYYSDSDGAVSFTEAQGSLFAKGIAGDFNPIHDPESRRFCVPGDLLFSVLLHRYGVARKTSVGFSGMLDGNTRMLLPTSIDGTAEFTDARDRPLLALALEGERFVDSSFISQLCENYVKFSGHTFPDILVPLMREAGVMINPTRPLVIYKDMSIELNDVAVSLFEASNSVEFTTLREPLGADLSLELDNSEFSFSGRKGQVQLGFNIAVAGRSIGTGRKNLLLSGLREYDESAMQSVVDEYNLRRQSYVE